MHVSINPTPRTSFGAVNTKYLQLAARDYELEKNVSVNWMHKFDEDVYLFKNISLDDAKDTLQAVKKYVAPASMKLFDRCFKYILYQNPS